MTVFKWGIFGTGGISAKFVAGLRYADGARAVMVASRTEASARAFAARHGIGRAVGGYAEAATAGGIDAAYIATPPSQHRAHALACIAAGIPVLIEKPFATDGDTAREIAAAARAAGVFCMEGVWTRFLPAATRLKALVEAGELGTVHQVSGSLGFNRQPDPSDGNFDPARGGGTLAHLGTYPLSLAQWLFGTPVDVAAFGRIGDTGVDEDVVMSLRYPGGVLGSFNTGMRGQAANDFRVIGDRGSAALRGPIYRPYGLDRSGGAAQKRNDSSPSMARLRESAPVQRLAQIAAHLRLRGPRATTHFTTGNGYHYEADEVRRCVTAGRTESAVMPLDDSIAVATTIDRVRALITGSAQ